MIAVLTGFLQGFAPEKIINFIQIKSFQFFKLLKKYGYILLEKGFQFIKQQISGEKESSNKNKQVDDNEYSVVSIDDSTSSNEDKDLSPYYEDSIEDEI